MCVRAEAPIETARQPAVRLLDVHGEDIPAANYTGGYKGILPPSKLGFLLQHDMHAAWQAGAGRQRLCFPHAGRRRRMQRGAAWRPKTASSTSVQGGGGHTGGAYGRWDSPGG